MNMNSNPPFDLVIGLDRSDRKADLHLIDTATGASVRQTIATSPESDRRIRDGLGNHPDSR